ncbi:MAG TPA: DNA repair exonuclease [Myxococcota bacterium]|nr:DNA repair exonuclease [Myxococcota bacterium]
MKFVHAADLHLDSPLRGLEAYEGAPVDEIRGATRRAVSNLVELCLEEEAALLVIAGDLYDGDWRDYNTGLFFLRQVTRLLREGVRVAWVRGNHDAASQITKALTRPEGAIEFATRAPGTVRLEDLGIALHGQSYGHREVTTDLAAGYPEPVPDLFNLGLLHTALDGRPGHDAYAPTSASRLAARGYDYWALGHVHAREVVAQDPWIVFPGNLQGRHAREAGPKGATVVTVEDGRVVGEPEHRVLDVVRWSVRPVDVSEAASGSEVVERVREEMDRALAEAEDRLLALRIELVGATRADAALRRSPERWEGEIRLQAEASGAPVWLEKIRLATRPDADPGALVSGDHPIARLARALAGRTASRTATGPASAEGDADEAFARELATQLEPLAGRLPAEYRQLADALDLGAPESIATIVESAEGMLHARLLGLGGEEA